MNKPRNQIRSECPAGWFSSIPFNYAFTKHKHLKSWKQETLTQWTLQNIKVEKFSKLQRSSSTVNKPGVWMEKRIYLMDKCLVWSWKMSHNELTASIVQNPRVIIISVQFLVSTSTTQRHTVRPLINRGKDQLESHYRGEIIQRVGIEKLLFGDKYTTFSLQWIICTYSKFKLFFFFRESIYQWNMICPW